MFRNKRTREISRNPWLGGLRNRQVVGSIPTFGYTGKPRQKRGFCIPRVQLVLGFPSFTPTFTPYAFLPLQGSIRFGQQRVQTERPTMPMMIEDVRVGSQGKRRITMPQSIRQQTHIHARPDRQTRVGVTQVMKANDLHPADFAKQQPVPGVEI